MRIEKGSRIKTLPVKVQRQLFDQTKGRFNGIVGNVGPQQSSSFSDSWFIQTVNNVTTNLHMPSHLPVSGAEYFFVNPDQKTGMIVPTTSSLNRRDIENSIQYKFAHENTSSFKPFVEIGIPELAKKESFFQSGSKVSEIGGQGFDAPLWSKTKIEIDLTPSVDHSFGITNFTSGSSNFLMAYWNKDTKTYEGIGNGNEFDKYKDDLTVSGLKSFLTEKAIGFGASLDDSVINKGVVSASYLIGGPINNFGFPNASQYEATSSNLVNMSNYINRPFLLEKMVLYVSAALDLNNYRFPNTQGCLSTFFVLNQRKGLLKFLRREVLYNADNSTPSVTLTIDNEDLPNLRDLVSWMQIGKIPTTPDVPYNEGLQREFAYAGTANVSGQFIVSGSVKIPIEHELGPIMTILVRASAIQTCEYFESYKTSGRNMINDFGRNYINAWEKAELFGPINFTSYFPSIPRFFTSANKKYSKNNPYILLPTDNLVFGWQVPYAIFPFNTFADMWSTYDGIGPQLTFSKNGIHKIIFYGSYLEETDKAYYENSIEPSQLDIGMREW